MPWLPETIAYRVERLSTQADTSLKELAEIDLEHIDDSALRPARIFVGLTFVGVGALMILLLIYMGTLHPTLGRYSWYGYIWSVSLGVAGMMMLGREAMRANQITDQFPESHFQSHCLGHYSSSQSSGE